MRRIIIATVGALSLLLLVATPASAQDPFDTYDKVRDRVCDQFGSLICEPIPTGDELDPRNWPCTCDPQPEPW